METPVVKISSDYVQEKLIGEVADLLRRGGIIGYPTETVYGLGGDATDAHVVERIYQIKGRDSQKPLLILVAEEDDVTPLVKHVSQEARVLMERFWPGPLTLVFQASPGLPKNILGERDRLGIRISSSPICRALLGNFQKPLLSTSANPKGEKPACSAPEVLRYFSKEIDLVLDGGTMKSRIPSTVLDVSVDPPEIIREGVVRVSEIEKVLRELSEKK